MALFRMNGLPNQPPPAAPRFFVVEDQVLVRELICHDLRESFPGCAIIQAGTLEEIRSIEDEGGGFDLAIVDLELSDGSAIEWVQQSMRADPARRIVILSAREEDYILYQAMHSDVPGFVHKNDKPEVLRQAVRTVLDGAVFYSPSVLQMCRKRQADPSFFNKLLTAREQEVLESFGEGLSDAEVAAIKGLSQFTVAVHRKQIMTKLGVHSQGEMMKYAVAKGFSRLR
jgi:DNA-binding NarL/FixJ family response regulator